MSDPKWDNRFMDMAELVASWSKDPSTKVGAVLTTGRKILGLGYNGFPAGCRDDMEIYHDRPEKYRRVVHAEVNALLNGTREGDMALYTTLCPCSQCAAMIINFGVKDVFSPIPSEKEKERWGESFLSAVEMFKEAKVRQWYLPNR